MKPKVFRPGGLSLTKKAADQIGLNQTSRVIDIGCGAGATLLYLKEKYWCDVCGIDLSEESVQISRENVSGADIRCENASGLSFESEYFDAAFMECTLTLFEDPAASIREAFRVLKDGGYLVISLITAPGPALITDGAADSEQLMRLLFESGFSDITSSDEKYALTQLYCDLIFEYGSLKAYLEDAQQQLGGTVLNCSMQHRQSLSYSQLICRK